MRIAMLALAVIAGAVAVSAAALGQDRIRPPAAARWQTPERWSFKRVDDGFVRLDAKTGQVAHCTPVSAAWTCEAVPEHRAALEKEVVQLRGEVAALKKEIAQLCAMRPPAAPPSAADHKGEISIALPTQQDVARAKDYLADTWRRLVQMIEQFQKGVLRNG